MANSTEVSILVGDGGGGFAAFGDFLTGSSPKSVTIGDFDTDSNPDLAVANFGGGVSVLLNQCLFGEPLEFPGRVGACAREARWGLSDGVGAALGVVAPLVGRPPDVHTRVVGVREGG